jgi:hypothetical protein
MARITPDPKKNPIANINMASSVSAVCTQNAVGGLGGGCVGMYRPGTLEDREEGGEVVLVVSVGWVAQLEVDLVDTVVGSVVVVSDWVTAVGLTKD